VDVKDITAHVLNGIARGQLEFFFCEKRM